MIVIHIGRIGRLALAADRAGDAVGTRTARIALLLRGAGGGNLAGYRGGAADLVAARTAHQIDMDMIIMKAVGPPRQHGGELLAGRAPGGGPGSPPPPRRA